jgi:hypothetical protein
MSNSTALLNLCPISCERVRYRTGLSNIQKPAHNLSMQYRTLTLFYDSTLVKVYTEILAYDIVQMMSAAGGTLGMYVGISLVSVMSGAIDWICRNHQ